MVLQLGVDIEELLIQGVLFHNTDIQGRFGGASPHVYSKKPPEPVYPLVTIRRLGGNLATPGILWLDRGRIQYDVWADTKKAAQRAASTVRAVLLNSIDADYAPLGRVTSVQDTIAPFEQEDPDSTRGHYIGEVIVSVHPI